MLRESITAQLDHDPDFRWRGEGVTRIENLSDIVFALALGMLISSGSPSDYEGLKAYLVNIVPVSAGFILMLTIWNAHFTFFRRYGLADKCIVRVNAALLLLILFIAYPLRFIFDSFYAFVLGQFGDWERMEALGLMDYAAAGEMMTIFCLAYVLIFALLLWMYSHALTKAESLGLDAKEVVITRRSIWRYRIEILIGIAAGLAASLTMIGPFAGFFFFLNWPVIWLLERLLKLPDDSETEA